jgi:hypothetical protein
VSCTHNSQSAVCALTDGGVEPHGLGPQPQTFTGAKMSSMFVPVHMLGVGDEITVTNTILSTVETVVPFPSTIVNAASVSISATSTVSATVAAASAGGSGGSGAVSATFAATAGGSGGSGGSEGSGASNSVINEATPTTSPTSTPTVEASSGGAALQRAQEWFIGVTVLFFALF